jgi:hypothetical protein
MEAGMNIQEILNYYKEYVTDDAWKDLPIKLPAGALRTIFAELDRLNRYITALENCEVRSKTVIKRLRTQTGMDDN